MQVIAKSINSWPVGHDPFKGQTTLSQGPHIRNPTYWIFTLWFITVAKLQSWSSNKLKLWLQGYQRWALLKVRSIRKTEIHWPSLSKRLMKTMSLPWGRFPVENQEPSEPLNQSFKLTLYTPSIHKQGERIFKRLSLAKLDCEVEETEKPSIWTLEEKKGWNCGPVIKITLDLGFSALTEILSRSFSSVRRNEISHKELCMWQWNTAGKALWSCSRENRIKARSTHHVSQAMERAMVVTMMETTSSYGHLHDEHTEHKVIGGLYRT